jgi:hypothetical protein
MHPGRWRLLARPQGRLSGRLGGTLPRPSPRQSRIVPSWPPVALIGRKTVEEVPLTGLSFATGSPSPTWLTRRCSVNPGPPSQSWPRSSPSPPEAGRRTERGRRSYPALSPRGGRRRCRSGRLRPGGCRTRAGAGTRIRRRGLRHPVNRFSSEIRSKCGSIDQTLHSFLNATAAMTRSGKGRTCPPALRARPSCAAVRQSSHDSDR